MSQQNPKIPTAIGEFRAAATPGGGGLHIISLIPSGMDDLLCLPTRLHIVVAARQKVSLADLSTSVGDIKGTYRHQALRLEEANYITIDRDRRQSSSLVLETTELGRDRLTHHIAAIHSLLHDLGMTNPPTAGSRRRAPR